MLKFAFGVLFGVIFADYYNKLMGQYNPSPSEK